MLVWDPYGKIVDGAVNTPGNYHDSRSTSWCNLHGNIMHIPDGFKIVCDSEFAIGGELEGKVI